MITATGNIVTSGYFIGNVIGNITGNVSVPGANTQVIFNNNGQAAASSALTFDGSTLLVSGNVSATTFSGSAAGLTSIPGANVSGTVANATLATSAGTATTSGTVTTAAQPNITSVGTLTSLTVTGNTTSGNLLTGGSMSATGNLSTGGLMTATGNIITNSYFIGNGALLTGVNTTPNAITNGTTSISIPSINGNANISVGGFSNVVVIAQNFTTLTGVLSVSGNIVTASGNLIANDIISTGSFTTVRANVSGSASVTGNITTGGNVTVGSNAVVSGQLSVTGNTTVNGLTLLSNVNSSLTSTGFISSVLGFLGPSIIVSGNVIGGNVDTAGQISATGNITAGNVYTAGSVTASGNVVAANFVGGGAGTPQLISNTSLVLGAATAVIVSGAPLRMASFTTTQRNALTAVNGDIIYNSTLNKFQGYENGAWANII